MGIRGELLELEARKCYPKNVKLSRSRFVEMMMLDAGSIIELFMEQSEHSRQSTNLFLMFPVVKRDMLLLENQLLFFVLRRLFELTVGRTGTCLALDKLAINFFNYSSKPDLDYIEKDKESPELPLIYVHHLLHLYHCLIYPGSYPVKQETISSIPCATMLDVIGVRFKRSNRRLTDMNFLETVSEVPRLFIEEDTVALLFNLIAFEQFNVVNGTQYTSYAVFMNYKVSKAEDVEFLCQKGILDHRLTNHEEVVYIFSKMCSGAFIDPNSSSLSVVLQDIKSYCESTWAGWRRTV